MSPCKHTVLAVGAVVSLAACSASGGSGDDDSGHGGHGNVGGGGTSAGGHPSGGGGTSAGGTSAGGTSAGGTSAGGSGGSGGCYREGYDLGASLSDLQASYVGSQWLSTMLAVLDRRYDNGYALMDAMKDDPWLLVDFPTYFDLSDWSGLMESVETACHEETHGWDFDTALGTPGRHAFFMGDEQVTAPELSFFARREILSCVQQGGSVTAQYDQTYLTGTQGSYDLIFLADEINAYTNGLACGTNVGDQHGLWYSGRDGVAAQLLYLLCYLQRARTQYSSLYTQWQGDADWQRFVRLAWARGHFWTEASKVFPALGVDDAAIWARINDPGLLVEMEHFTGQDPAAVACSP